MPYCCHRGLSSRRRATTPQRHLPHYHHALCRHCALPFALLFCATFTPWRHCSAPFPSPHNYSFLPLLPAAALRTAVLLQYSVRFTLRAAVTPPARAPYDCAGHCCIATCVCLPLAATAAQNACVCAGLPRLLCCFVTSHLYRNTARAFSACCLFLPRCFRTEHSGSRSSIIFVRYSEC